MNHIPTNHFTPLDNADLSLVPPTTRQCGSLGKEIPVYLGGLSSDFNLALDVNTRAVPPGLPQTPQGTHYRNVKSVHHPTQCRIWPDITPQVTPQTTSSHPQFGTLPAAVAPQPTFCAFEGTRARSLHPSLPPSHRGSSSFTERCGTTPQVQGAIPQVRLKAKRPNLSTNLPLNFHPPVDHQLLTILSSGSVQM